jgi:hypothetical protein
MAEQNKNQHFITVFKQGYLETYDPEYDGLVVIFSA